MAVRRLSCGALTALVLVLSGGAVRTPGQEPTAIERMTVAEVIAVYLLQDCGTGDANPSLWLDRVVAFGPDATPPLLRALREGPAAEERSKLERAAADDFRRLRGYLEEGGLRGLEEQDVREAALALDEKTYTGMRVRGFVQSYRERALNALLRLDDPSVRKELEDYLGRADEEIRRWLEEALRQGPKEGAE